MSEVGVSYQRGIPVGLGVRGADLEGELALLEALDDAGQLHVLRLRRDEHLRVRERGLKHVL